MRHPVTEDQGGHQDLPFPSPCWVGPVPAVCWHSGWSDPWPSLGTAFKISLLKNVQPFWTTLSSRNSGNSLSQGILSNNLLTRPNSAVWKSEAEVLLAALLISPEIPNSYNFVIAGPSKRASDHHITHKSSSGWNQQVPHPPGTSQTVPSLPGCISSRYLELEFSMEKNILETS